MIRYVPVGVLFSAVTVSVKMLPALVPERNRNAGLRDAVGPCLRVELIATVSVISPVNPRISYTNMSSLPEKLGGGLAPAPPVTI